MYINGTESFRPGILYKTLRAIEYCHNHMSYHYLVRSNISTIIDFSQYKEEQLQGRYMGCSYNTLQWLDHAGGIHDRTLWGTEFVYGTGIVLPHDSVTFLLQHKDEIRVDLIDDVAIGLFFSTYPQYKPTQLGRTSYNDADSSNAICYRNRTNDRQDDIKRMKQIVSTLLKRVI